MKHKKLIYIASPYAGDIEQNVAFAQRACRLAISQGYTPLASHLIYPQMLDDNDPLERRIGMELGLRLIDSCEEIWLCGDVMSAGMAAEKEYAESVGLAVRTYSMEDILKDIDLSSWANESPVLDRPDGTYRIWATIRDGDRNIVKKGVVGYKDTPIRYEDIREAASVLGHLQTMQLSEIPKIEYRIGADDGEDWDIIEMKELGRVESDIDAYDLKFEIKKTDYGNTGGNFYVAAVEAWFHRLNKSLWLNAGEDGFSITTMNVVWGDDNEWVIDSAEVCLLYADYADAKPSEYGQWEPVLNEMMEEYCKEEMKHHGSFSVEPHWMPNSVISRLEPEAFQTLCEKASTVSVEKDSVSIRYLRDPADGNQEFPLAGAAGEGMAMQL